VKEILVDDDTIVSRHPIPAPTESTEGNGPTLRSKGRQSPGDASYLLRKGSNHRSLPRSYFAHRHRHDPVFHDTRLEPFLDQANDALIADPVFQEAN
jgi:site-specific DNA recombinase